jgi:hypothetical protein
MHSRLALIIATRYSESRCQFSNPPSKTERSRNGSDSTAAAAPHLIRENPVMEYQLQQYRLLLPLSFNLTFGLFSRWLWATYFRLVRDGAAKELSSAARAEVNARQNELHAISSGSKPVLTWLSRDAITACRECMGGHGFSSFARIGQIKREAEPSVTYEGENHVLIQQTAKFVADAYRKIQQAKQQQQQQQAAGDNGADQPKRKKVVRLTPSPLGSLSFLSREDLSVDSALSDSVLGGDDESGEQLLRDPEALLRILQWRVVYLLQESGMVIMTKLADMDGFQASGDTTRHHIDGDARFFLSHLIGKQLLTACSSDLFFCYSFPFQLESKPSVLLSRSGQSLLARHYAPRGTGPNQFEQRQRRCDRCFVGVVCCCVC